MEDLINKNNMLLVIMVCSNKKYFKICFSIFFNSKKSIKELTISYYYHLCPLILDIYFNFHIINNLISFESK